MLQSLQEKQVEDVLEEEWAAVKGYLRFGPVGPDWFYDKDDPDENFSVERLRRVFLLTDAEGHKLQYNGYDAIGFDSPDYIKSLLKLGPKARAIRFGQITRAFPLHHPFGRSGRPEPPPLLPCDWRGRLGIIPSS